MICQCRCLSVGLVTNVTRVRLIVRVYHVMLVQTRILCEAFVTANHLTDVGSLSWKIKDWFILVIIMVISITDIAEACYVTDMLLRPYEGVTAPLRTTGYNNKLQGKAQANSNTIFVSSEKNTD